MEVNTQKIAQIRERIDERFANELTQSLVEANRVRNKGFILRIAALVPWLEPQVNDRKAFIHLLLLIHPDKFDEFRRQAEAILVSGNAGATQKLFDLAHFNRRPSLAPESLTEESLEGLDEVLAEEFALDEDEEGETSEGDEGNVILEELGDLGVLDALRFSEYGNLETQVDFQVSGPDFEEAFLAGMGVVDLEGVSHLKNLRVLDICDNKLVDLDELSNLDFLEELYCSNNRVADVSLLSCCESLKIVDLSHNQIIDASGLASLPRLEFANLMGNKIPAYQIRQLQSRGVEVMV